MSKVSENSNAAKAGIRGGDQNNPVQYGRSIIYFGGDVIINIDGIEINSLADLFTSLEDNKPGETVIVKLLRGKREISTNVILSERLYDFLAE